MFKIVMKPLFQENFICRFKNRWLEGPICIKERADEYTAQNLHFQVSSFVATAKIYTEGFIGTIGEKRVSFGDASAGLRKRGATVNREPH